jgi:hypothetical protein
MSEGRAWREGIGLTALDYPVPIHANTFWYSLGGLTLLCFVVAFITGAVLTQFYNPAPAVAHASVRYSEDRVHLCRQETGKGSPRTTDSTSMALKPTGH